MPMGYTAITVTAPHHQRGNPISNRCNNPQLLNFLAGTFSYPWMDGQSELPASDSDEVRSVTLMADVPVDRVKIDFKTR